GRMSPSTAAVLFLAGPVVPMLLSRADGSGRRTILLDLAGCLATIVALVGTAFVLGYLHGTPLLYGTRTIPMAATTALAVLSLGTGQLFAVGRDGFPLRLISGPSARARLLRLFVSTMVVAMLAMDLLRVYLPWVFFENDALLAGISTALFALFAGGLIAGFAWRLGGEMDRSEEVRNAAMDKLRESEDRYRDLVEHSRDLICTHDLEGRILSVNPWAAKVLGYAPEELLGRNFRELLSPKSRQEFGAYMDGMRKHCASQGLMVVQTRSGEKRIWEYKNTLRTEGVAEPIVRGMARDITERRHAENALRESERRYSDMLGKIKLISMTLDRDARVTFCNDYLLQLTGWRREEVLGSDWFDRFVPPGNEGLKGSFAALLDDLPSAWHIESEILTRTGERRLIRWNNSVLRATSGEVIGTVSIGEDITERKRAEAEKEKLQGQLVQAMKMEAVGRLAGGVAHDFNNILTAIIGNVSLAHMKLHPSDPAAGMLAEANKAAERAATLTQQLLAFSRKQIIEPKVLSLNDLIADLKAMLVRLIREDIELQVHQGRDLGAARVDASQFQQVLVNLVVNARDAMPNGGKIDIETSNAELDDAYCASRSYVKPGRFVMVAVSDTGHGMSEEVKSHIFEPFFTTKAKGSGTGLGLATAYGAVKQAGGSIEVGSEVGTGTTFRIYLPRVEGEASKPARQDLPRKLAGGAETVLLVEDEKTVRNMCATALDALGYKVLQASNGEEAIAVSRGYGGRIDLLLTDVVMPGMNGGELAKQLILHRPGMRVLFTSGYTEDVIVHHGVLNDEISFLGKPYSPSLLAKKIREVLDKAV
ncbi:MAG TPA: PAS domain S-box protein, partial [Candidatus Deferrimicrobium sp.]